MDRVRENSTVNEAMNGPTVTASLTAVNFVSCSNTWWKSTSPHVGVRVGGWSRARLRAKFDASHFFFFFFFSSLTMRVVVPPLSAILRSLLLPIAAHMVMVLAAPSDLRNFQAQPSSLMHVSRTSALPQLDVDD